MRVDIRTDVKLKQQCVAYNAKKYLLGLVNEKIFNPLKTKNANDFSGVRVALH